MITKSDVANLAICERRMFLSVRHPHLAAPLKQADRARLAEGRRIGELARRIFDAGVLVSTPSFDIDGAVSETRALIEEGASVIFESAFFANGCTARPDVLQRSDSGAWNVFEVKSSLSVKQEHIADLAFQCYVLQLSGIRIAQTYIVHIDSAYVSDQPLTHLFQVIDVTEEVSKAIPNIESDIQRINSVVSGGSIPEVVPNTHCKATHCPFLDHCFASLPEFDITLLPRIKKEFVEACHLTGDRDVRRIDPKSLTPKQRLVRNVIESGKPFYSADLSAELKEFVPPIAFVDFESDNPPIPVHPGVKPYEQVLFQWSMHVLHNDTASMEHREFIHRDASDPRPLFVESLAGALQDVKTIVTYTHFEKSRISDLARATVPLADNLKRRFDSSQDLHRLIDQHVMHPAFRGQTTIKVVYPALVAGGGYDGLDIKDGALAASEYRRMLSPATTPEEAERIAINLLEYCKRDTLAMVEVFLHLRQVARFTHFGDPTHA